MKYNQLKEAVINFLLNLFQEKNGYGEVTYDAVDDFFAMIGYDYNSQEMLWNIGVQSTSDLHTLLSSYEAYLNGALDEARWSILLNGGEQK